MFFLLWLPCYILSSLHFPLYVFISVSQMINLFSHSWVLRMYGILFDLISFTTWHHLMSLTTLLFYNKWLYNKKVSADLKSKWKSSWSYKAFYPAEHLRDSQDPNNKNRRDFPPVTLSDSLQECENIPELLISAVWLLLSCSEFTFIYLFSLFLQWSSTILFLFVCLLSH